ncbi:MAG: hypothetical protein VW405_05770 [Rhodospirillaceae bacterium]
MTALHEFAVANRLHVRRSPEDGSPEIAGRAGSIYPMGDGRLVVLALDLTKRQWSARRRLGLSVRMTLHQDGDAEGSLVFDPHDPKQAEVAIRIAGARRKRRVSAATAERLREAGARHRFVRPRRRRGLSAPQIDAGGLEVPLTTPLTQARVLPALGPPKGASRRARPPRQEFQLAKLHNEPVDARN